MKLCHASTCAVILGVILVSGCSRKELTPAATGDEPTRDYSQVLRNVRERSAANMGKDRLHSSIAKFETELGRPPTNLTELVRYGFIDEIPDAPEGKMFVYDPLSRTLDVSAGTETVSPPE